MIHEAKWLAYQSAMEAVNVLAASRSVGASTAVPGLTKQLEELFALETAMYGVMDQVIQRAQGVQAGLSALVKAPDDVLDRPPAPAPEEPIETEGV